MLFDVHNHLGFNQEKNINITIEQFISMKNKSGVDYSVLFPLKNEKPDNLFNKEVLKASRIDKSIIPFMRFKPRVGIKSFINKNKGLFRGIKVHPKSDGFAIDDFNEAVSLAEEHDLIILFHSSKEIMIALEPVFKDFKKVHLIAAHATAYAPYKTFFSKYKNLFYDTSIKMSPMSMKRLAAIDEDRILFGSDYPYSTPLIEKSRIELCPSDYLTKAQKTKILSLNAMKLFGIKA